MKLHELALCLAFVCLFNGFIEAKTVFRRGDKISENFKQLNLPSEEIDPNVAPPEPQKVETIDPEDIVGTADAAVAEEMLEEQQLTDVADEVIDESANEIEPAAAVAGESAASSPAAPVTADATTVAPVAEAATTESPLNKYCKCTEDHCDCCRNFNLPLIPVRGPGCAKITYLGNEKMSVAIKYGDITLATRTISSKNAKPICVGLPGGYSKFCGRVYGLAKAKNNFKACLGFELRADDEVEAALRVSCFKFGPDGLKVAEAEPFPAVVNKDEDDEDDIFGFAAGGDEEDEDDDYDDADDTDDDEADDSVEDDDEPEAPEDADYGGFSLGDLFDDIDDDDEPTKPVTDAVAAITPPPAVDQTRTVQQNNQAQSKLDKDAATLPAESGSAAAAEPAKPEVTPATAVVAAANPPANTQKPKKAKKSKKKKAVAVTETDFAYEILNGLLDFFN